MNKPVVIGAVLLLALAAWKLSNHEPDKRGSGPASPDVGSEGSMSSDSPAASSVPGSASQAFQPGSAFEAGLLAGLKAREFGPTVDELATHDPNPRNPLANEYLNLLETTLAVFNLGAAAVPVLVFDGVGVALEHDSKRVPHQRRER